MVHIQALIHAMIFFSGSPPHRYTIEVEPEEEDIYGDEGDTTIRAEGTDILRM